MSTTHENTQDDVDPGVVHVIQSEYHYRDVDNRPVVDESILDEEGWFHDVASAQQRTDQLNEQNRRLYDLEMARARRNRDQKIADAEQANREAEILRAAGVDKALVAVPTPFEPIPFEQYTPDSFTKYRVLAMRRSELDGIAGAASGAKD